MGERQTFKRSLLGISPSNASSYLRQQKKLQAKELSILEMKIRDMQDENAKLRAELSELTARQQERSNREQYQDLIRMRGEEALRVLYLHTQEELAGLQNLIEQKRLEHQQKIDRIEQQTEYYKQSLQSMLQEFGATMQKFNSSDLDRLEGIEMSTFPANHLDPFETDHEEADPLSALSLTEQAELSPISTSGPVNATAREEIAIEHRQSVSPMKPSHVPTSVPLKKMNRVVQEQSSEFWGNIQSFVDGGETHKFENLWELEASASVEMPPHEGDAPLRGGQASALETRTPARENEGVHAQTSEIEETKASEAVSTEIMSIRNRYIVGKTAGDDLLDSQGRLIVAKGETISAQVVEIAEREGRLPDLIVNMKIPGVSVDKP